MKVLYIIRNGKNYDDVVDVIICNGESWGECEEKFINYIVNPDNNIPEDVYSEKFIISFIEEI